MTLTRWIVMEYTELFPNYFKNPEVRRRNAFCYIDGRDLGQIVDLCLKKDGCFQTAKSVKFLDLKNNTTGENM